MSWSKRTLSYDIYSARGDKVRVGLNLAAAAPFAGWDAIGTKLTPKIVQKTSKFDGLLKQALNIYPN